MSTNKPSPTFRANGVGTDLLLPRMAAAIKLLPRQDRVADAYLARHSSTN